MDDGDGLSEPSVVGHAVERDSSWLGSVSGQGGTRQQGRSFPVQPEGQAEEQLVGPADLDGQREEATRPSQLVTPCEAQTAWPGDSPTVRVGSWDLQLPQSQLEASVGQDLTPNEEDTMSFDTCLLKGSVDQAEDRTREMGPTLHGDGTSPCTPNSGWFLVSLSEQQEGQEVSEGQMQTPQRRVQIFCSELRQDVSPLLAQPATRNVTTKQRRPRQKRAAVTTARRSVRLAKGGRGSKASKQQAAIIKKLCLANEGDQISDEALQAYARLFDKPLVDSHIQAILPLFGWDASILPLQGDEDVVAVGQKPRPRWIRVGIVSRQHNHPKFWCGMCGD
ncbi:hypothetical protein VPH35_095399 [Triticum aestivum]